MVIKILRESKITATDNLIVFFIIILLHFRDFGIVDFFGIRYSKNKNYFRDTVQLFSSNFSGFSI